MQHHHAHVASVMGEHGLGLDDQVIGVAFDGTGYGTDGAIWGGEVLVAGYKAFRRAAHLGYVPLAGGDASVRRPYRMALAHLRAAGVPWTDDLPAVAACPARERSVLAHQLDTGLGCVPTSSMGRLFDAVSSLAGVRHTGDYEAEAAMRAGVAGPLVRRTRGAVRLRARRGPGRRVVADPDPLVRAVVDDLRRGPSRPRSGGALPRRRGGARRRARAAGRGTRPGSTWWRSAAACSRTRCCCDTSVRLLEERGFTVLRPRLLPPNDGGIALGQVLVGSVG